MASSDDEVKKWWSAETRAYAEKVRNVDGANYTINIPGVADVVRIGAYEDKQLKIQRWLRYKNTKNPAPAFSQAAAQILNYIDDAQDLLFTALALAWPLLRRLPARMVPGLGWILTINDILNLMTCIMGSAARPGLTKPECFSIAALLRGHRPYGAPAAFRFLSKFPLLGFALQAPQALYTVTHDFLGMPGYGVLPGPVMGLLSDVFWGLLRDPLLKNTKINTPPPDGFAGKAVRFLSQPPIHHGAHAAFSLEDHLMLSAAYNVATQVVDLVPMTEDMIERAEALPGLPVPQFTPWTYSSMEICLAEGWRPEQEARDSTLPELVAPTYGDVLNEISAGWAGVEQNLGDEWGQTTAGTINSMMVYEAGNRVLDWLNGGDQVAKPRFTEMEQVFARQFEFGVFPPEEMTREGLELYLQTVLDHARARGANQAGPDDYLRTRLKFFPELG